MQTLFSGSLESLSWLINYTKDVSILICLIFVIKFIAAKRLPAWWSYSLWLILLVRMLIPWNFENRMSITNVVPASIDKDMFGAMLPAKEAVISMIERTTTAATSVATSSTISASASIEQGFNLPLDKTLLFIWLAGAIVFGIYILAKNIRFWIMTKRSAVLTNTRTLDLLEECKGQLNVRKAVDIIITDKVKSPALFGYFRPRLLLPEGILEHFSHKELSYVFMHELGHLKRHDIAVIFLMTLFQTVHWFNPLVWLAFYQMRIDQESACDASVLSRLKKYQSIGYANTLIAFLERYCHNRQLPSTAGILENKTQMKRRLTKIVQYRKLSKKMSVIAVALFLTAGFIFYTFTGCTKEGTVYKTTNKEIDGIQAPHSTLGEKLPESNKVIIAVSKDGRVFFTMDGQSNMRSLAEQLNAKFKLGFTEDDIEKFSKMSGFGMPCADIKGLLELSNKERAKITQPGIPYLTEQNELDDWITSAMIANPNAHLYFKVDKATPYAITHKVVEALLDNKLTWAGVITDNDKIVGGVYPEAKSLREIYVAPIIELESHDIIRDSGRTPGQKVPEKNVLNIFLDGNGKIFWYVGITNAQANETDYAEKGIWSVLREQYKLNNNLIVLIKPADNSIAQNLMDIQDGLLQVDLPIFATDFRVGDEDKAIIQKYLGRVVLEIRPIETSATEGFTPMIAESKETLYVAQEIALSNKDVASARVVNQQGVNKIELTLTKNGANKFANLTEHSIKKRLGILIDGKLITAPTVMDKIVGGKVEIIWQFTQAEAERIANGIVWK